MTRSPPALQFAWPIMLAAVAVLATLVTACMMPLVAVATLAAATMTRAQGIVAVAGAWAASQLLGFELLGFPLVPYTIVWGLALGAGGLAALGVARSLIRDARPQAMALPFLAAFATYEALLFAFALVAGGTETFTLAIVARLFANEAVWLIALGAFAWPFARMLPSRFGRAGVLRVAE